MGKKNKTWNVFCFNGAEKNDRENCRQQITAGFGWQRKTGSYAFSRIPLCFFLHPIRHKYRLTNTHPNKTENVPVVFRNHGSRLKHWFYWWMWLKQSCGVQCVNVFLQRINQQAAVNPQQALSKCRYVLFTHLSSWTHTNNASVHCISILLNFVRPCPSCLGYEQVLNVQPPMGGCETPCLLLSAAGRRAICLSHLLLLGL